MSGQGFLNYESLLKVQQGMVGRGKGEFEGGNSLRRRRKGKEGRGKMALRLFGRSVMGGLSSICLDMRRQF